MLYVGFSKKANINFGRSNQVKMARNRKYQILTLGGGGVQGQGKGCG